MSKNFKILHHIRAIDYCDFEIVNIFYASFSNKCNNSANVAMFQLSKKFFGKKILLLSKI